MSSVQRFINRSIGERCKGLNFAASRDKLPVGVERRTRALRAALHEAADEHRRVHGARRCAGNCLDLEPRLLKQSVEHAPGERAMRAPALQGEIDENRVSGRLFVLCRSLRHD